MEQAGFAVHDWENQTTLHPFGLLAVVVLGIWMVLGTSRRHAMLPMIIMACFIAPAQRIVIAGLDFNLLRVMVIFGWLRVLFHGEYVGFRWKKLDKFVLLWTITGVIAYTLLHKSTSALVVRLGWMYDVAGAYFLFRCLIRTWEDVKGLTSDFILVSIPTALGFMLENATGRNIFSVFGGVPEETLVRDGKLRCQGAFPHPILAGCFWATMMPLMAAGWWDPRGRRLPVVMGLVACLIIVILCASSTPMGAVMAGVVAGVAFTQRSRMRTVRWGIVFGLLGLHLVMNQPVWHLICRIDLVGGSTGWHRFKLIDSAIENFGEWALIGVTTTAHWGYGLFDVTNQYVLEGVRGGFLALLLFVAVLGYAFRGVGRVWRTVVDQPDKVALAWAMGVVLLMHVVIFLAVAYFDQVRFVLVLHLGIIGSMIPEEAAATARAPAAAFLESQQSTVNSRQLSTVGCELPIRTAYK